MLERARARQEKIDQKLASSGQFVPKRKPLTENSLGFTNGSSVKSPSKPVREIVKSESPVKSPSRTSGQKTDSKSNQSPHRPRDVIVTKKEFNSPKRSNSSRQSDVSVEINILHKDNIQIEVQVEERDAPLSVICDNSESTGVIIKEIEGEFFVLSNLAAF